MKLKNVLKMKNNLEAVTGDMFTTFVGSVLLNHDVLV